jgi:glycine betaine/proline transport system permease protein
MMNLFAESTGHFVDRAVGKVTDLETGDQIASAVASAVEFLVLIAVFAIPVLVLLGSARRRRVVTAVGGAAGLLAVIWYRSTGDWDQRQNTILDKWQIPVGDWVEQITVWVDLNMKETLAVIKWPFQTMLEVVVDDWLLGLSWMTVCLAALIAGWAFRGLQVGVGSFLGLTICGLLGDEYWKETARTIGFIAVAVILCVIIGIPTGVACGRIDGVWRVVRPLLDAMQVVHSFVYMLPFVFFFGVGFVSATMVTMVFALPPLIRLTNLGIRQVPEDVVEAARAYGASERRVLTDVQLPLARAALMTGINQTLLLAISMLGIAAIMGAGGLGRLLYRSIANQDIALAGSGGLAFFIVAVVLDRLTQPDESDRAGLFSRMTAAWKNTRTPEALLPVVGEAAPPETVVDDEPEVAKFEPVHGRDKQKKSP